MSKTFKMRSLKLLHYAVTLLLFFACWEWFYGDCGTGNRIRGDLALYAFFAVVLLLLNRTYNVYDVGAHGTSDNVYAQSLSQLMATGMLWGISMLMYARFTSPVALVGLLALLLIWNMLWCVAADRIYKALYAQLKTVVIYRDLADLKRLREIGHLRHRFNVQKYIEGPPDDFQALRGELLEFDAVVVSGVNASLRNGIAKYCVETGTPGYFAPHVGDIILRGARYMRNIPVPLMSVRRAELTPEYRFVKRAFDIVVSTAAIVIFSPCFVAVALAIRLYDHGPVFYRQRRLTQDRRVFRILKFRSMRVDAEKDGVPRLCAGGSDNRVTPVGRLIRACRMDELPQLFNVLKGEMSLVGPRPERPEIAAQYEAEMPAFGLRLQVKAGLTGCAQVYGRYNTDPYSKLQMDLMYINKMSVAEDLRLLFATIRILFLPESTEGVAEGQTTAMHIKRGKGNTEFKA